MEKAHLYEALYLVNHGIDEAVRGVQRLKSSGFAPWVQPAHLRFVSIARAIPLCVAHPPP